MKKLVYGAALLVVAAGSVAFLPKQSEPVGYMMVIGQNSGGGMRAYQESALIVIDSKGQSQKTELKLDGPWASQVAKLHQAEIQKLSELKSQGWVIIQTNQQVVGSVLSESSYVLEKR